MIPDFQALGFAVLLLFTCGAFPAQAQETFTIEGRVVEADTERGLPGANVQIAGTSAGTATQDDGRFSLTVELAPGTYTLQVTFIGYQSAEESISLAENQSFPVGTIALQPDVAGLEEVVVTGQASPTRRKELGNAISSVEGADLQEAPNTSALQSLQGQMAGVQIQQSSGDPSGGTDIRLRGTGTVLGSAGPLIVLDGVIISNDSPELIPIGGLTQNRLLDINPNDIERVEAVKGAAAAALFGSRANNGVVQIFTKMGEPGETEVTYSTRFETNSVREKLDVNMAQNDQGQFLDNSGNPLPDGQRRFDAQDFIFERAYGSEQSLSVSGGSEDTRFFVSGAYSTNQGIVDESSFRRWNATARVEHTLSDWADVSAGARYANSKSDDVPNGGLNSLFGSLTGFIFGPNTFDPRPNDLGEFPDDGAFSNPLEVPSRFDFGQETNRFIGDFQFNLTPVEGLKIDYVAGLDVFEQVGEAFIPRGVSAPGFGTGFARRAELTNFQLNTDLNARYETTLLPGLSSTSLVGSTLQYQKEETFNAESQDLAPIAQTAGSGTSSREFGELRSPLTIWGVFGQQKFGINDRLFITGALRFDVSSSFAESDRGQLYPKVSSSLVLSDYGFWQESLGVVLPSFKIRGSVGWSGGLTSIGAFDRFTVFNAQSFGDKPGLQPSPQLGAEGIEPERQREIEIGADFEVLTDRLSLRFTYFDQKTDDLLLQRSVAPTTGFDTELDNIGTVENTGVELRVEGVPLARENVRWTTTATYTRNRNEVNGIPGETGRLVIPNSFTVSVAQNGESIGSFFGPAFKRNDAGEVVDQNGNPMRRDDDGFWRLKEGSISQDGDGIPAQAERDQIIGDPTPDFTISWLNQFEIGNNLRFRFQFDSEIGQDIFNFTRRVGAFPSFGTLEDFERELEGDLPSGYGAQVFNIFENWIEDGTYLKLREVAANYTFRPSGLPVESVKVTASGQNLLSFDDFSGYDPEINTGGQRTGVRGFAFVVPPIPRTFSFGATLTF